MEMFVNETDITREKGTKKILLIDKKQVDDKCQLKSILSKCIKKEKHPKNIFTNQTPHRQSTPTLA